MTLARCAVVLACVAATGCAPRLKPLPGLPVARALPAANVPPGYTRVLFRWELNDAEIVARGEGAARIASPDSARLDFFLGGGIGGGAAVLIGDRLILPDQRDDLSRKLVPPAPLLWASLGRLAVGPLSHLSAAANGDTLRADVGNPVVWRVTFVRDTLVRLERVDRDRVLEWVDRSVDGRSVRYRHEGQGRRLDLVITSIATVSAFDPEIWVLP